MNLFKNILYTLFTFQEKFLKFRLSKTLGVKNKSRRKRHYSTGCTLDLNSLADIEKQQLEDELYNILKACNYEIDKLIEYIKAHGTVVKILSDAKNILNPIGENEGFIYPASGARALYLSLAVNKEFALKTNEMFILPKENINKYYFLYHLYNWFAFKHNIEGMDSESQELLKKYLFSDADTKELQLAEIYKLKDAIRQDKASIEFVVKLCRNYDGAKQALNKMHTDGSAKI